MVSVHTQQLEGAAADAASIGPARLTKMKTQSHTSAIAWNQMTSFLGNAFSKHFLPSQNIFQHIDDWKVFAGDGPPWQQIISNLKLSDS